MTSLDILQKYWHYDDFRPLQAEIIDSVLEGNDTLALLPTGGGKSICYQVPALMTEGICIVISPLIALMKDQVQQLRQRGIKAAYIVSGMTHQEIEVILNNCIFNRIKMLYVSPERLQNRTFIEHFRQMNVNMIAVDEAHCISQWGYDFRPPYLEIARIRQYHPKAPVLALTATATPEVAKDIKTKLDFHNGRQFQSSFLRANISYCVRFAEDKQGELLRMIRNIGGSGIVYVRNRKRSVETAYMLNENDIPAYAYHAGIAIKERDLRQRQWLASSNAVMVATTAFGMGIDKADVRFVIHLDIPESPEAYFQEAGRAGRDGKKAFAAIIYNHNDTTVLQEGIERDFPPIPYIKNVYRALCNYYQIPVGAGTDSRFDFKLDAICQTYGFDYYLFFSALKFIEREGLVSLPEHNELQSKLYIPINKEELYRFQVENRVAGDMLTTILRLYGGLFTDFTAISEHLIAKRCEMSETQVVNTLSELSRLKIVDYQKRTVHPQIVFTSPRIDINDLHISDENYKELKNSAIRRRKAMLQDVNNDTQCRSVQLLDYFGETAAHNFLICDVCMKNKDTKPNTDDLEGMLKQHLQTSKLTVTQLSDRMPTVDNELLTSTVRRLLDKGELTMDQDFFISCRSSE